jgi:hypothetical protein
MPPPPFKLDEGDVAFLSLNLSTLCVAGQVGALPVIAGGGGGRANTEDSKKLDLLFPQAVLEFLNNLWGLGTELE